MQVGMKHQRLVLDQILVERETPSVISSNLVMLMPARAQHAAGDAPATRLGGAVIDAERADLAEQARDDRVAQGFRTSQPRLDRADCLLLIAALDRKASLVNERRSLPRSAIGAVIWISSSNGLVTLCAPRAQVPKMTHTGGVAMCQSSESGFAVRRSYMGHS